jgi:hypothetical protein
VGSIYTAYSNRIESAVGDPAGIKFCSGFLEQEYRSGRITVIVPRKTLANLISILN